MIIFILIISPLHEKRQAVLDTLLSVKGPVLAEPGCLTCSINEEYGEEQSLLYIEQWRSLQELERHIASSNYSRILEAMELSARNPEIFFHETGKTWGFELIERVRTDHLVSRTF